MCHDRSVGTSRFRKDLDLGVMNHLDGRRLEIIADGSHMCNSPWTRLWCLFCAETTCPAEVRIIMQVWHCTRPQRAHTPWTRERGRPHRLTLHGRAVNCLVTFLSQRINSLVPARLPSGPSNLLGLAKVGLAKPTLASPFG